MTPRLPLLAPRQAPSPNVLEALLRSRVAPGQVLRSRDEPEPGAMNDRIVQLPVSKGTVWESHEMRCFPWFSGSLDGSPTYGELYLGRSESTSRKPEKQRGFFDVPEHSQPGSPGLPAQRSRPAVDGGYATRRENCTIPVHGDSRGSGVDVRPRSSIHRAKARKRAWGGLRSYRRTPPSNGGP
jgi:hypothetical protein